MVYKIDDGFEELNSGCDDGEPEDAGPGVMGHILISLSHVKGSLAALSPRRGRTLNTPRGIETSQQESEIEDWKDGPHNVVESKVGDDPQDYSRLDRQHDEAVGQDYSSLDQQHDEAVSLDSSGGQIGDAVVAPTGSSRSVDAGGASLGGSAHSLQEETPASPRVPPKDLGERIMSSLPGSHTNPYSVGSPTRPRAASHHDTEGDHSAVATSPSIQRSSLASPASSGKLELITKLMDKFHLHENSSSPRAAIESPGTPSTNTSIPSANTGMPTPTIGAPSTTIGTATGPTEN